MVTIALVRDYERFKIMDINGTHYYWLIWLFWSQKVAKMAIFQTEYLKLLQLVRQVHVTKKWVFRLNFIIPGVPDSENWRFLSYQACQNGFFTLFSTVFPLWAQYRLMVIASRAFCHTSDAMTTLLDLKYHPQAVIRWDIPANNG